jgi:hypothetical protein
MTKRLSSKQSPEGKPSNKKKPLSAKNNSLSPEGKPSNKKKPKRPLSAKIKSLSPERYASNKKPHLEKKIEICVLKNPSQKEKDIIKQVLNFNDILKVYYGYGQEFQAYEITKDDETHQKKFTTINEEQLEIILQTLDEEYELYTPIFHSYYEGEYSDSKYATVELFVENEPSVKVGDIIEYDTENQEGNKIYKVLNKTLEPKLKSISVPELNIIGGKGKKKSGKKKTTKKKEKKEKKAKKANKTNKRKGK